jgi:hypothetical protein
MFHVKHSAFHAAGALDAHAVRSLDPCGNFIEIEQIAKMFHVKHFRFSDETGSATGPSGEVFGR